jgi:deoxyribodipyrimidine photo-lyase
MNIERLAYKNEIEVKHAGPVVYWMSRDQRINCNWSLIFAIELAHKHKTHVEIVFALTADFLSATYRQYDFMLDGLAEVEKNAIRLNFPFSLLTGNVVENIQQFALNRKAIAVVTDFDPLRIKLDWQNKLKQTLCCSFYIVDAHNVVPCVKASMKQEFGAYTIRPKIKRLLPFFLDVFPLLKKQSIQINHTFINWKKIKEEINVNRAVSSVKWIKAGEYEAKNAWRSFLQNKLTDYNEHRNNPVLDGTSNISPFIHFGHLSVQELLLDLAKLNISAAELESFIDELLVRRELSDNFCYYQPFYDNFSAFPDWAKKTLNAHKLDEREYIYTEEQFEQAETHDHLWNAAQSQMVTTGKMHGYMRMYWAKKILEWTVSPEEAFAIAIKLNDKYELDGRDPNGYAGCAWAIGGLHDRAWSERPVYGKIRYMNDKGCARKFDVKAYIKHYKL